MHRHLVRPLGVSLLELMVVVAILGITVAMGATYWASGREARQTQTLAEGFYRDVMTARSAALTEGAYVAFECGADGYRSWREVYPDGGTPNYVYDEGTDVLIADVPFPRLPPPEGQTTSDPAMEWDSASAGKVFAYAWNGYLTDDQRKPVARTFSICQKGCAVGDMEFTLRVNRLGMSRFRGGRHSATGN